MTRIGRSFALPVLLVPLLLGAAPTIRQTAGKNPVVQQRVLKSGKVAPLVLSPSSNYSITWSSMNGGGMTNASSTNYAMGSSAGQSAAGSTASAGYKLGIGFWYGVGGCNCPRQGDINADGVIDVFDVIGVIDIAFSGGTDPQDPGCPKTRGDVNNDGVTDVFDVIYLIATAFSGGPNPVNPCAP